MNDRFSADDLPRKQGSACDRSTWPIELAHIRPFRIGDVEVRPASREVAGGNQREVLEPRVMQVLVALASARGEILSRDDLIEACWEGRAVSDDAINRVLSRLRALSRTFEAIQVETITKVGYRLVGHETEPVGSLAGNQRRRLILAGGAVASLGLLGVGTWRLSERPEVSPEAQLLLQKGLETLQSFDVLDPQEPGPTLQAIALLTDATRAAPGSATAWGALALAYASRKRVADLPERPGLALRSRAAAKRSLAIDPLEARALGALRLLDPIYRNWAAVERADREALARNPRLPLLNFVMSDMLGNVGRWKEAAQFSKRLDRKKFLIPGADRKLLIDLWASGDLQGADNQLEVAVRQWPQHPQIWRARVAYLMYTGRPREVLPIARDVDRPVELKAEYLDAIQVTAQALAGDKPAADAVGRGLDYLKTHPSDVLQVAQACVALGANQTAFELFDGYYFGEGAWSQLAPKGGDQDRLTNHLFQPVMGNIWREPAFDRLLDRIGLNAYWRQSGTLPDYRRA